MAATATWHGSEHLTADSVLGAPNVSCRVFSVTLLSGGTAGTLVLRNGQDASGTIYVQQTGIPNESAVQNWEQGLYFPDGCFYDHDANNAGVTIEFRNENI